MRILHVAAGLPTEERPFHQPFIQSQIKSLKGLGIDVEVFEIQSYNSKAAYFKAIKQIREIMSMKNYDIIHAHYSYCGLVCFFAKTKKPIILSLMGSDLIGYRNNKDNISLRGKIDKLLTKFTINKMNYIIVKSKKMKGLINTNIPVSIVPNGINMDVFKPEDILEARKKIGFNNDDFIILFLGSKNNFVKNYDLAEKAATNFKKLCPERKVIFSNPYGIDPQKVVDYMNASNVLLLTSFYEGSPNVIKEAMACNLPIISVDVGDVKERLKNTSNCFIVDYSKEEISEKLEIIYTNMERTNGREMAADLSSDKIARRIIEIYNKIQSS